MDVRICVVFIVLGGTFALTRKGFYCRDPDTGKLHAVNTTWRSSSFCGNYTCKLKKKDLSNSDPIREFKVSHVDLSTIKIPPIESLSRVQNSTDEEKRMSSILDTIISNINEGNTTAKVSEFKQEDKKDRYLNDNEIKMLSDILHSVKKSDLEAVVDIYNLAQDIYKELDKKTSENFIEETVNKIQSSGMSQVIENGGQKKTTDSSPKQAHNKPSYWYEPSINSQKVKPIEDLNTEGSDIIPSVYSEQKYSNPPVYSPYMSYQNYERQPYYYDLTDFQRQSSYVYAPSFHPSTQENSYSQPGTDKSQASTVLVPPSSEQQQVSQPILLPYPYYQVHYNTYNTSGYPYQYYYGVNPYHDVYNQYYASPLPVVEQGNVPERFNKPGSLLDALLPKDDNKKKLPDWKTGSLTDDVIEDIRGHFEKNMLFKPLCLRKKVKLEKVGKVFKLDDVNREKRSTSEDEPKIEKDDDEFEVYIERTTCQSDVDPGFFRMGNDSAAYPACCPQRISR